MKQKICPMTLVNSSGKFCIEERCILWIEKGTYEMKENAEKTLRIHEPVGCCALMKVGER